MPANITRTCPVCSITFTPRTIRSCTCSKQCGKRAEKLRAKGRAYDSGEKRITEETLATIIHILEADEAIAAQAETKQAARVLLEDECDNPVNDALWREAHATQQAVQKKLAELMRQDRKRLIARGWKPIKPKPPLPPEQRPRLLIKAAKHLLFSKLWSDPSFSNRKFNAGRRQMMEEYTPLFPDHMPAKWDGTLTPT